MDLSVGGIAKLPLATLRRGITVLDAFAGLGSMLEALVEALRPIGGRLARYIYIDVAADAEAVVRHGIPSLVSRHPDVLSKDTFSRWELPPADIQQAAATAPAWLAQLDGPCHLFIATQPCQDVSRAGPGLGLRGARSSLVFDAVKLAQQVRCHNEAWPGDFSPGAPRLVWFFETAPPACHTSGGVPRPLVIEAERVLALMLGSPMLLDAVTFGASAHRRTAIYTNALLPCEVEGLLQADPLPIARPLATILPPGFTPQVFNSRHAEGGYRGEVGCPAEVLPKLVSYPVSYSFRPNRWGPGLHGLGVVLDSAGRPCQPCAETRELALGREAGFTARGMRPDGSVFSLSEYQRRQLLGQAVDVRLFAEVFKAAFSQPVQQNVTPGRAASAGVPPAIQAEPEVPSSQPVLPGQALGGALPPPLPAASSPVLVEPLGALGSAESADKLVADAMATLRTAQPEVASVASSAAGQAPASFKARAVVPASDTLPSPLCPSDPEWGLATRQWDVFSTMWDSYEEFKAAPTRPAIPDDEWLASVHELLNDSSTFRAGNPHRRLPLWDRLFERVSPGLSLSSQAKWLRRSLRKGFSFQVVSVHSECQQRHPRFEQRLELMTRLLRRLCGGRRAAALLQGGSPHCVAFPNLPSCEENRDFVAEAIGKLLATGAAEEWHWPDGQPPQVINPLGVVTQALKGKSRLILAPMYVNLFIKHVPFQYEGLQDLTLMMVPDAWLSGADLRSGYHHAYLSPEAASMCGFEWEGTTCVFKALPFGISSACRDFTDLMGVTYAILRSAGIRLVGMIDDSAMVNPDRELLKYEVKMSVALLSALGFYFSPEKCSFLPSHRLDFLGLIADTGLRCYLIPERKLEAMENAIDALLSAPEVSPRALASIAGQILSARLALHWPPFIAVASSLPSPAVLPGMRLFPARRRPWRASATGRPTCARAMAAGSGSSNVPCS